MNVPRLTVYYCQKGHTNSMRKVSCRFSPFETPESSVLSIFSILSGLSNFKPLKLSCALIPLKPFSILSPLILSSFRNPLMEVLKLNRLDSNTITR